jgi:Esterase FrsA-like
MGIYPFMYGKLEDFEPIFNKLIELDLREPYDFDQWAETFFPTAEKLILTAEKAEEAGDSEAASAYYMRASAVYRIARFPIPSTPKQKLSWEKNKVAALKGLTLMEPPVKEILVPHKHAIEGEGEVIPIYHQVPPQATEQNPAPSVIIFTGLDGYRTELVLWTNTLRAKGCGIIVVEIPGTGDSPALANDPEGGDRQWSSLLDWVATQPRIDSKKLVVWGFSTGGYYAMRIAHTHADRIMASIPLGGGWHHCFDKEWTDNVNHLE